MDRDGGRDGTGTGTVTGRGQGLYLPIKDHFTAQMIAEIRFLISFQL